MGSPSTASTTACGGVSSISMASAGCRRAGSTAASPRRSTFATPIRLEPLDRNRPPRTGLLLRPLLRPVARLRAQRGQRNPDGLLVLQPGRQPRASRVRVPPQGPGHHHRPAPRVPHLHPEPLVHPAREAARRSAPGRGPALKRDLALLALLGALLFLPGLGARDLWNPDEARYAEVAREMRQEGSWAIPRLNGEVYTQKPPLLFWLIIVSSFLTGGTGGVSEISARIPSALAAIGTVILVFRLGERLFNRRAGWIAAGAFATCFKILWQGRFGQIDMLLTFLVALGVWFWVRGYTENRPGLYPLFFVATGLATLAKGPAGFLPPLLAIVAFLMITQDWTELRRMRIGIGFLVWAAVVLAWLIPAGLSGGREYLDQIVFRQNVTRYADPWHHFQPWYYYLTVIPAEFFPWSFLLPTALMVKSTERKYWLFALCWMVVTAVFFSLSP